MSVLKLAEWWCYSRRQTSEEDPHKNIFKACLLECAKTTDVCVRFEDKTVRSPV